ncbi:MAG: hypothetical protein JWQ49_157 [Edaphobacter sp.]|nr:hypothetical protein [Edaphobacter sp.]
MQAVDGEGRRRFREGRQRVVDPPAAGCLGRECGTELRLAAGAAQEDHHYLRDMEGQRSAKIFFHEGEIDAGRDSG